MNMFMLVLGSFSPYDHSKENVIFDKEGHSKKGPEPGSHFVCVFLRVLIFFSLFLSRRLTVSGAQEFCVPTPQELVDVMVLHCVTNFQCPVWIVHCAYWFQWRDGQFAMLCYSAHTLWSHSSATRVDSEKVTVELDSMARATVGADGAAGGFGILLPCRFPARLRLRVVEASPKATWRWTPPAVSRHHLTERDPPKKRYAPFQRAKSRPRDQSGHQFNEDPVSCGERRLPKTLPLMW